MSNKRNSEGSDGSDGPNTKQSKTGKDLSKMGEDLSKNFNDLKTAVDVTYNSIPQKDFPENLTRLRIEFEGTQIKPAFLELMKEKGWEFGGYECYGKFTKAK